MSLFLFDIIFFVCLGFMQGKEDGMNSFCYIVIASGIISGIFNICGIVTSFLGMKNKNGSESSFL